MRAQYRKLAAGRRLDARICWLLSQSPGPLGIYEIAARLTDLSGRRCFPNSVYRALQRMARSGTALQIVSANGWMLRDPEEPGPVLVLICENCGGGSQHPAADLGQAFGRLCKEAGFDLQRPHLELIGTCESCRTTAGTEQDGGRIYATL